MKLSEFSAKNVFVFNLLAAFIAIAGILALFKMPRETFPKVNFDVVIVETRYPGADASDVERKVTTPLEKELNEVDDIKEMTSTSIEGNSMISLTIEPDARHKDRIISQIERAVDRAKDLPPDLPDPPRVEEIKSENIPAMRLSISGPFDQLDLQTWAKKLEERLFDIPDVATVKRDGYLDPQLQVSIDPQKLKAAHLSLLQVAEALERHNISIPAGSLIDGEMEIKLRTVGEFFTPEEIRRVIIRANDQGHALKVGDVAAVTSGTERPQILKRTDGERAILLTPLKRADVDIFDLKQQLQETIGEFKKIAPPALKIAIVDDTSYYVERRLNVLLWNGLIGFILITLSLFTFLRPSAAIGAILGMPTAFLATIALMHAFGMTINLLSMFGLIIVIGMLVDEDIVIAENIHRLREEGKSALEATIEGAKQVSKAVITTVLTTITAFIPLLIMTGIVGKFVREIPQVVIITLTASLVEALFILPAHIATLSKYSKTKEGEFKTGLIGPQFLNTYERILRKVIKRRYAVLALFLLSLTAVSALGYSQLKFILFPKKGVESFIVQTRGTIGTPLLASEEKMKAIEAIISTLPQNELDHYVSTIGLAQNDPTDPFTVQGSNIAQIQVFLTAESARNRDADQIIEGLRPLVEQVQGFEEISINPVKNGPPIGKPVAIRVRGDDFEALKREAMKVKQALSTIPGVSDIRDDGELGRREKTLVVDAEKLAQAGLTLDAVATSLRFAYEGGRATYVRKADEDWDVVVKFPEAMRHTSDSLKEVTVGTPSGHLIPLSQVASFVEEEELNTIKHHDRKRSLTVTAEIDEKNTSAIEVNTRVKSILDQSPPTGDLRLSYGGEMEDTDESMESFYHAFFLALLLTFIIIAASLRDLAAPFVILFLTISLGVMGVIIGFLLAGKPLSFLALLGVVAMAGIVVDTAILIVDFIHKKEDEGLPPLEAIVIGAKLRLRPILLTGGTTILGIIPTVLGIGGNDPFIQPMALALNWGIGFATVTTIFLMPVAMAIERDIRGKWRGKKVEKF